MNSERKPTTNPIPAPTLAEVGRVEADGPNAAERRLIATIERIAWEIALRETA